MTTYLHLELFVCHTDGRSQPWAQGGATVENNM